MNEPTVRPSERFQWGQIAARHIARSRGLSDVKEEDPKEAKEAERERLARRVFYVCQERHFGRRT